LRCYEFAQAKIAGKGLKDFSKKVTIEITLNHNFVFDYCHAKMPQTISSRSEAVLNFRFFQLLPNLSQIEKRENICEETV
jgi:hypothetical protein